MEREHWLLVAKVERLAWLRRQYVLFPLGRFLQRGEGWAWRPARPEANAAEIRRCVALGIPRRSGAWNKPKEIKAGSHARFVTREHVAYLALTQPASFRSCLAGLNVDMATTPVEATQATSRIVTRVGSALAWWEIFSEQVSLSMDAVAAAEAERGPKFVENRAQRAVTEADERVFTHWVVDEGNDRDRA